VGLRYFIPSWFSFARSGNRFYCPITRSSIFTQTEVIRSAANPVMINYLSGYLLHLGPALIDPIYPNHLSSMVDFGRRQAKSSF
jgi:hypothetical protein